MRVLLNVSAGLALLLPGTLALADQSENCATKIVNLAVKVAVIELKAKNKICKGLDDGAEVAFDDPGNNDGAVDSAEIADAADFAKLTDKINKLVAKINVTAAKGGTDCTDHLPATTFPIPDEPLADVQDDVAFQLNGRCH